MVIEQRNFSNIRFGDDVGIWEGSMTMRSCISCLRRK